MSDADADAETAAAALTLEILSAVYFALYLPGAILFVIRRNHEPIKSRLWILAFLQMSVVCLDLLLRLIGPDKVGCFVSTAQNLIILPVWAYPFFIRGFALWYRFSKK